ncbi:zf-HC2 domain-containing protein [Leifsonia poae]|uniref:Anti-sigma factor n=1 Tax=Leifsonia poae TaxID=110933 RepID=A0A9W6M1L8_9MICO|nr:zf-HC2 domain-containing protein [Leifsonia poae]GLJ77864.1 anti-sigma factor [Leifsonia poae]
MTTHDQFATWDGAYVLGALSPTERRAYEEHLRTCSDCATSMGELAGLPGILGRVAPDDAFALLDDPTVAPTPQLLPALLSEARRRRTRRRWWTAGALAAAAAIIAISAVVVPSLVAPPVTQQAGTSVQMTQVEPSALSADLKLVSEPWGTRIESRCSYAEWAGSESGRVWTYAMVVTDRSGVATQISTWTAQAGSTVEPVATTSVPLSKIASVDIRSATDGTVLLRSTFG